MNVCNKIFFKSPTKPKVMIKKLFREYLRHGRGIGLKTI